MELVVAYVSWLDRLGATYDALRYTCGFRLDHNDVLGQQVAVAVVAQLLARPRVFRYQGLPFSGRIGTLAEPLIELARSGELRVACRWSDIRDELMSLSTTQQRTIVMVCVDGCGDEFIAATMRCSIEDAVARRAAALEALSRISELGAVSLEKRM